MCLFGFVMFGLIQGTESEHPQECDADPIELQPTTSTGDRQRVRLLVIRTHRCASTAFGGWILRAAHASNGRLEAYRSDDGEVARTGVTAWAAHANDVLDDRTVGPLPLRYTPYPAMARDQWHTGIEGTDCQDDNENCANWADTGECDNNREYMKASCQKSCGLCTPAGDVAKTLVVAFIRSPVSQFPSAYGSFKSSQMGYYGESLSDTLSRPPQEGE
jgi:hypothetical protein